MKKSIFTICIIVVLTICLRYSTCYGKDISKIYLKSSKSVLRNGDEVEVSLMMEGVKTAAFTSFIYFDDFSLDYISGPDNTNVIGNKVIFVWHDVTGGNNTKTGELAKFRFKAKNDGIAELHVIGEFFDKDGELIDTSSKTHEIEINSNDVNNEEEENEAYNIEKGKILDSSGSNTNLETLAIEDAMLNSPFDNNIIKYNTQVANDVDKVNILAIAENEKAKVRITGGYNLKEGDNIVKVTVTSEDGLSKKTFVIVVYKRNKEEDKKVEEEQKENEKKLEKIYETEKVSTDVQPSNKNANESKQQSSSSMFGAIVAVVVIGIAIVAMIVYYYKKRNK